MFCNKRSKGFTLVELMVVIAIVAILTALAFPSFEGSMRATRVATSTNEMMASLSLARSEAIRSSRGSQVCASANGTSCGGTWNDGWMVATDNDTNPATYEQVVRVVQAKPKMAIAGGATQVNFDRRGRTTVGSITIQPDTCPNGQQLIRTLSFNGVGQMRIAKGTCP